MASELPKGRHEFRPVIRVLGTVGIRTDTVRRRKIRAKAWERLLSDWTRFRLGEFRRPDTPQARLNDWGLQQPLGGSEVVALMDAWVGQKTT